jgi:hypothetical protein
MSAVDAFTPADGVGLAAAAPLAAPCMRAISSGESFFPPAAAAGFAAAGGASFFASGFLADVASGFGTIFKQPGSMSYQPMLFQASN